MRSNLHRRGIATTLLHGALKIAPPYAAEWGRAMLSELHHVEGEWHALAWALGGASVLAKHAFLSAFTPDAATSAAPSDQKLFAKGTRSLITAAACLAASLLFFVAPTFRQAFKVSLAQWHSIPGLFRDSNMFFQEPSELSRVEREARANHDAEGLAFVAISKRGTDNTAELADEAVSIDPNLGWIYSAIGARYWGHPMVLEWLPKLRKEDQANALPHLIASERMAFGKDASGRSIWYSQSFVNNPAWQKEMAAAFSAPSLGTYDDKVKQLDRDVSVRYHMVNPYEARGQYWASQPYMAGSPNIYAKYLMDSAKDLASHGNYQAAISNYQTVIHFERLWLATGSPFPLGMLDRAYRGLSATYEAQGDKRQAQEFATLEGETGAALNGTLAPNRQASEKGKIISRNAAILEMSGLAMLSSACIVIGTILTATITSGSIKPPRLKLSRSSQIVGAISVAGFALSTVAMYLAYRPYAGIAEAYLYNGDSSKIRDLSLFLSSSQTPPGAGSFYQVGDIPMYFWVAILALCAIGLVSVTTKFLSQRRSAAVA
jgi:hypothetical protein